jgi:hypothetical protein
MQRLWERGADGGAVEVRRFGPKEAQLEAIGCELFDVPYFRIAFRGVLLGAMQKLCTSAYVRDVSDARVRASCTLRFQWV